MWGVVFQNDRQTVLCGKIMNSGRISCMWTCMLVRTYTLLIARRPTRMRKTSHQRGPNSYCELNSYDTLSTSHKWFLILVTTLQLVIYHCISFLLLHKKSSTCWLLLSVGQRSRHNTAGLSAQADWAETKVWAGAAVSFEAQLLFQPHSCCWQNSVPCGARTEVPIFLLAVG